jgi:ABC-2 type transport system ATP-binding protein
MLTTLQAPDHGSIGIDGWIQRRCLTKSGRRIGIVFQDPSLDARADRAGKTYELHGVLYHVPRKLRLERAEMLLKLFELWEERDAFVKTFCGGMKRRLEKSRAGFCTRRASCFSTSPRSASIRKAANSSGRTSSS